MDYKKFLTQQLELKKSKNPSYSLRAYAQWLDVSPAHLSQVISGIRPMTNKISLKIVEKFNFSPAEKMEFFESVHYSLIEEHVKKDDEFFMIQEDEFKLIADWQHFAILSCFDLKGSSTKHEWFAKKLGIDVKSVDQAIERLTRLNIIAKKNGKYVQIKKPIRTTTDIPVSAIRKYHAGNLELAREKMESVSVDKREFTAITMAVNPKKLKLAKELMTDFKRRLSELLEYGEKTEVYTFSAQLFPVTKLEEKE